MNQTPNQTAVFLKLITVIEVLVGVVYFYFLFIKSDSAEIVLLPLMILVVFVSAMWFVVFVFTIADISINLDKLTKK